MAEIENPRWGWRAECMFTAAEFELAVAMDGAVAGLEPAGWLVVEVHDYDRIGDDDPMGRVEVSLAELGVDQVEGEQETCLRLDAFIRRPPLRP